MGYFMTYRGYKIHDVTDAFVITDEHGATIGESKTESGAKAIIDAAIIRRTFKEKAE